MASIAAVTVRPARAVVGRMRPPGDKSVSHRYALLAALAEGRSCLHHFAPGADCGATLACLRQLGVEIAEESACDSAGPTVWIWGRGVGGLRQPPAPLDAHNSGTTARLLAGMLAGHSFRATLTGDASLRCRPMDRVIRPLELMGARIDACQDRLPLTVHGARLRGIDYTPEVASAQVKSAVLLAGLHAEGRTSVRESIATRDHTEQALTAFGGEVDTTRGMVALDGGRRLRATTVTVPGDVSSAAFWAAAAAALPDSDVQMDGVGLNPTRIAFLDVLRRMGARVDIVVESEEAGEPRGHLRVRHQGRGRVTLGPADVPGLVDELPALAALASHGGMLEVTGASELRVKESDRIAALVAGLRDLGADADEWPDGFRIDGRKRLRGGTADAAGDHRLAMAFAIAALGAMEPCSILGAEAVAVSYPGFFETLTSLAREGR